MVNSIHVKSLTPYIHNKNTTVNHKHKFSWSPFIVETLSQKNILPLFYGLKCKVRFITEPASVLEARHNGREWRIPGKEVRHEIIIYRQSLF